MFSMLLSSHRYVNRSFGDQGRDKHIEVFFKKNQWVLCYVLCKLFFNHFRDQLFTCSDSSAPNSSHSILCPSSAERFSFSNGKYHKTCARPLPSLTRASVRVKPFSKWTVRRASWSLQVTALKKTTFWFWPYLW